MLAMSADDNEQGEGKATAVEQLSSQLNDVHAEGTNTSDPPPLEAAASIEDRPNVLLRCRSI